MVSKQTGQLAKSMHTKSQQNSSNGDGGRDREPNHFLLGLLLKNKMQNGGRSEFCRISSYHIAEKVGSRAARPMSEVLFCSLTSSVTLEKLVDYQSLDSLIQTMVIEYCTIIVKN